MSKKYYVWKDPACGGENIEWQMISGAEFCAMMRLPENKGRRFIPFADDEQEKNDTIYIEATKEQYSRWHKENNAYLYRRRINRQFTAISMNCSVSDSENAPLSETIPDTSTDTEAEAIRQLQIQSVQEALRRLSQEDRWLIEELYMKNKSTSDVAAQLGISKQAVSKRAIKLLKNIKKFF